MNANEIVRALRDAEGNNELDCEISELRPLLLKAANLIKSLQAKHEQAALNYQQKCIDVAELEAQLSASQRREKAAVEDLCGACEALTRATGHGWEDSCYKCQWWRGPQDAVEGEAK